MMKKIIFHNNNMGNTGLNCDALRTVLNVYETEEINQLKKSNKELSKKISELTKLSNTYIEKYSDFLQFQKMYLDTRYDNECDIELLKQIQEKYPDEIRKIKRLSFDDHYWNNGFNQGMVTSAYVSLDIVNTI